MGQRRIKKRLQSQPLPQWEMGVMSPEYQHRGSKPASHFLQNDLGALLFFDLR